MRQSGPQRRGRGRPSGRRGYNNSPNRSYDSSGPEVKIRGTASTVYEKYQALARDAVTSGDRVAAENYFQHAEHYYRVMQATKQQQQAGEGEQRNDQRGEQRNDQRGEQRNDQRDNRGRAQQNRNEHGNDADAPPSDEESSAAIEEAVIDASPEEAHAEAIAPAEEAAETIEASANDEVAARSAPMNPAELAAMSESGRMAGDDNSLNGQDKDALDEPAAAPRRQPRRRRRPAPEPEVVEVEVTADQEDTAAAVVEDVEP
ncbi:MAG: DUF4167 domain-containing protein, partial [Rhodospirillaceae bacterium]|nr:DUF4167 domain-containing protein [Rhodospirillaceae bacterium]